MMRALFPQGQSEWLGAGGVMMPDSVLAEALLGRRPVELAGEELFRTTQGKAVLVTGAGGSIGAELCRQIVLHRPKRLVLYEISEAALYRVDQEVRALAPEAEIIPCLGDVKDEDDLRELMTGFAVQTVYHAAAYKHVPLVEQNAFAGLRNNIFGTLHAARASGKAGVERFVLISTDKAVRPACVMGASKRMAELVVRACAEEYPRTCFSMVRFGNVLGSSGSVFPLFCRQIAAGGPVTVTHRDVTRFFMTMPEAVQLVLQAGGMARGGEVFILNMGEPVRIFDMARSMVQLAGKTVRDEAHPDGDIEIRIIGLRPGEKLHEQLFCGETEPTAHPRIVCQREQGLSMADLRERLAELDSACRSRDFARAVRVLALPPVDYAPSREPEELARREQWQDFYRV